MHYFVCAYNGSYFFGLLFVEFCADNGFFFFKCGIINDYLHHETVGLGFGKIICTFLLYRVLCGEHKEGFGKRECLAAYRNLSFLHGFKECALHFCGSAVYFIGKNEICKYRTAFYNESFCFLTVNQSSDYVGGQKVRGKLHTIELGINKGCECFYGECLCKSGHTLQQNMSV